jgi:hypothetical protein
MNLSPRTAALGLTMPGEVLATPSYPLALYILPKQHFVRRRSRARFVRCQRER